MLKKLLIILLLVGATSTYADGLLIPSDKNYPKDFLTNRMTQVKVLIHGLIAETYAYQEFVNEWDKPVDAVYCFPLPADARATEVLYWRDEVIYKAVLKKREQAVNPGTGEGGVAAEVNQYLGRNAIKIELKAIPAGKMQRVEIRYISLCQYDQGVLDYRYPLNSADFVQYPLQQLQCEFHVWSNSPIVEYSTPLFKDSRIASSTDRELHVALNRAKHYCEQDIRFQCRMENMQNDVDFYSIANDSSDGHFALFVRPPAVADTTKLWPRRVLYLLGNSSRLSEMAMSQALKAMEQSLQYLKATDEFNIILYNWRIQSWQSKPVAATSANKAAASQFLKTVGREYESQLALGLTAALQQITDNSFCNSILLLSDGRASLDPKAIAALNTQRTAIVPVAVGHDPDRSRLEMLAGLNYGFVTYLDQDSNILTELLRVLRCISQPLLQEVAMEYGRADLHDVLPAKLPAAYAGSYFFTTGRYRQPGSSVLALAGKSINGIAAYDFHLEFTTENRYNRFAAMLWAKEMIDELERQIDIYGPTPAMEDSLVKLSLAYNIRCRYTAYIADYITEFPSTGVVVDDAASMPITHLLGAYPNPFNATTMISFYLSEIDLKNKEKFVKIYNLLGQLVAVIDISHLTAGFHQIRFDGLDTFGQALPTGVYFVRLQCGRATRTVRITLLR